ncbi:MAG: hypothetical protein ACD_19C00079G0040 [uncultured bacterium]|nr:MAG: hypothetical protein ACD_19C00079G0040 [uncultured bacterium]
MAKYGFEVLPVAWDDESEDLSKYKTLIFRSCWNYHYNTEKFTVWLDRLKNLGIKTWNPIDIIPTLYLEKGSNSNLKDVIQSSGWPEVVIKPTVGASAYKIFKSTVGEAEEKQSSLNDLLSFVDVMIQPLIPELVKNGETSMIFLNKKFSHAVNRRPKLGDFRSNHEFGGIETRIEPKTHIVDIGQSIVNKIKSPLLYARVDGVEKDGKFLLMELELIEPYLFFDVAEEALDKFASALNELEESN